MAIFHFVVGTVQRSRGQSVVAVAARRSGTQLYDEGIGRTQLPYLGKVPVHSEILRPDGAPGRWMDRATLWNEVEVEVGERRKNSQLARTIEISLPRELSQADVVRLARDFVREQFVVCGMVADLNVHWGRAKDGAAQPHADVMLTMRRIAPASGSRQENSDAAGADRGFGLKEPAWNDRALLRLWRARWAEMANAHLAEAGSDARIDHRSHFERGIDLEPQNKIGPSALRRAAAGERMERVEEHAAITGRNAARLAVRSVQEP